MATRANSAWKERSRSVLSTRPARAALRLITHDSPLPFRTRRRIYLKVGKKIRPPAGTVFDQPVPGSSPLKFVLDGTVRELFWVGAFEIDSLPLFAAYARQSRCVLDIGAAEGLYGLVAAAVAGDSIVFAFEPGSAQVRRLLANLELNSPGPAERIRHVEVALSDHDGEQPFYELPGGTSSLNPDFRDSTEPRIVGVTTGDAVLTDLLDGRRVDLVKVDTESTEPEVLMGLRETLRRDRPVIFCEVLRGRSEDRLQPLVDDLGYETWWLGPDGPVHRSRIAGVPGFVNWLFLPDDRQPLENDPIF